jgi:acetyl esterase/lipase
MATRRALLASAALSPLLFTPTTAQEATPVSPSQMRDVSFGEVAGRKMQLDVWSPPPRESPRPAIVVLYSSPEYQNSHAFELASSGYVVFAIAFLALPDTTWPGEFDQVQRAVRWARANAVTYGVDPERIGSYGHSAGGQLSALLGVRDTRDNSDPALASYSSRVQCVVSLSGIQDLSIPFLFRDVQTAVEEFLGGTREEVPDNWRDASPISWVDRNSAPFLMIHGTREEAPTVEHSRAMEMALHEAGVPVVYYEDPDANHETTNTWSFVGPWVLTFFAIHLDPEN